MADPLAEGFLDVLACPADKASLRHNKAKTVLVCEKCEQEYAVKDGIPVLMPQ